MAAPVADSITPTPSLTPGTSHDIDIPAMAAGDLVVLILGSEETATPSIGESFWSNIDNSGGSNPRLTCFALRSPFGRSAGPVTVSLTTSQPVIGTVFHYLAADVFSSTSEHDMVEVGGKVNTSSGTSKNHPAFAPSWGAADYTYIVAMAHSAAATVDTKPSGYTHQATINDNPGTSSVALSTGYKATTGSSSENADAWVLSASSRAQAFVVAIRPPSTLQFVDVSGSAGAFTGTLAKRAAKTVVGVTGAAAGTVATAKTAVQAVAGAAGVVSGTLSRATYLLLSGDVTGAGVLLKQSTIALAGAMPTPSGDLDTLKASFVSAAGTAGAVSGTLARAAGKVLAGSWASPQGLVLKVVNKVLTGAWAAPSATLGTVKSYLLSVAGTAGAVSGALTKSTSKALAGAAGAFSGQVTKRPAKVLAGAWAAPAGVLSRIRGKPLAGAWGARSGALTKRTSKALSGAWVAPSATLGKSIRKVLAGSWGSVFGSVFAGTLGNVGLPRGAARILNVTRGAARLAANPRGMGRFFRPGPGAGRKR